jgi:phosphinothricin acetyltransferase
MHPIRIRLAEPERDAGDIAAIYAPHVLEGLASFEEVAPDAAEMARRIEGALVWAPWIVAVEPASGSAERVVGYACATRHSERAGYRWGVNLSVYIAPDRQRLGLGRRLYDALLPILREQRFLNAYAGIALPNPGSVALHEAIGMRPTATYIRVGWKHGQWLDVVWLHLPLVNELPSPPPEPIALPDLLASPDGLAPIRDHPAASTT